MKKSPLKRIGKKALETPAQKQLREALRSAKLSFRKQPGRIRSRKVYVGDILCDSAWEAEGYQELLYREKAGEISDLDTHKVITFRVFNEADDAKQFQINIDFEYFDNNLKRWVRRDRKSSKKLVKKTQADWLLRWELLKFAEPLFQYELEYMK